MRTALLISLAFLFGACAGKRFNVKFPDDSQDAPLWACMKDGDDTLACLDFKEFLKYLAEQRRLSRDSDVTSEM